MFSSVSRWAVHDHREHTCSWWGKSSHWGGPLNDMVFRMCFCCLVALVVAANRCIICPGLAAKRSASTSRQAHLCQWKVTWCASVSLSSNVDSMKFQVWADTEKITLASSSGVVFLLAVHLSDLAVHSEVAKIDFRSDVLQEVQASKHRRWRLARFHRQHVGDLASACQAFTKACNLSSDQWTPGLVFVRFHKRFCQAFGSKSWLETLAANRLFHPANFRFVCKCLMVYRDVIGFPWEGNIQPIVGWCWMLMVINSCHAGFNFTFSLVIFENNFLA